MNKVTDHSSIDPTIAENAMSIYGQTDGAYSDFPVLKAFQQYIDQEQAKARNRMMMVCVFFSLLMFIVIGVFVALLLNSNSTNQQLNNKLVEYVMQEREKEKERPVVVQAPPQDNSAILTLTSKLGDIEKKLAESQAKAEQAAINATKAKEPTPEELEIKRLKTLLEAEKEKQAAERERLHQLELEEYRRKHYPELYEKPPAKTKVSRKAAEEPKPVPVLKKDEHKDLLDEVDQILKESESTEPVSYFDEKEEEDKSIPASAPNPPPAPKKDYKIPVDIRGSSSQWNVPNE